MFENLDRATKLIITEYITNKKTIRQIIKDNPDLGVSYVTIKDMLNKAGFSLRTQSEAMKVYWKNRKV